MASQEESAYRTFAGMDEAGLGPILGPLTIGFSSFRAPRENSNLWSLLRTVVSSDPKDDKDRFIVADSKRVFTRNPRGSARLERTALGFLSLLNPGRKPPSDARQLLERPRGIGPGEELLARHPWYAHLDTQLPREFSAGNLELRVEKLHRVMSQKGVELLDAGVRAVPVGALNRSYAETHSKGLTLWRESSLILQRLWRRHGVEGVRVVVDRHGGRSHYGNLLRQSFPRAEVEAKKETPSLAEYLVRSEPSGSHPGRRMLIAFAERAEERSFAVALGSCLAKYVRETCMHAFNAYFESLQPGLKPTAGYRSDGWRWMKDAAPALERSGLARELVVRER